MNMTAEKIAELEMLEELSETAAIAVSGLIEGTFVENDGASTFVYIPITEDLHATAAIDTLDHGVDAKWTIHYDFGVEVWTSEYDSKTAPEVVAAWVEEKLAEHAKASA